MLPLSDPQRFQAWHHSFNRSLWNTSTDFWVLKFELACLLIIFTKSQHLSNANGSLQVKDVEFPVGKGDVADLGPRHKSASSVEYCSPTGRACIHTLLLRVDRLFSQKFPSRALSLFPETWILPRQPLFSLFWKCVHKVKFQVPKKG